ncbi:MAG: cysteine desulfurase [Clostridia bacterium]|nr:cysteine desulfurase [Clostridia bacterium]
MEAYLDNSATTRPCEAAILAAEAALREGWHNPSALYRPALEAQKRENAVREACLRAAGAEGQKVIFTGSGTEADNLAILGAMRAAHRSGRVLFLKSEHPAVSACEAELMRMGHKVEMIPVMRTGVCDLQRLEAMLGEDVVLIAVMQVNNEVGAIQPLAEIAALRDRYCPGAWLHVDGVQGFLRVPLQFNKLGLQSYALSGHKIHACKGIGALIVRRNARLNPLIFGGGQEDGLRSGTENTVGIAMLGAAIEAFPADAVPRMAAMKKRLWEGISMSIPGALINGPMIDSPESAPHILNMSLQPVRSQTMLFALEGDGIYVSAGSACASHKQRLSPVLSAMNIDAKRADCALRFSLCPYTTEEEIDWAVACAAKHYALLSKYVRR